MVWISNGILNPEAQPFKILPFFHKLFEIEQKHSDFELSSGCDYSYSHIMQVDHNS